MLKALLLIRDGLNWIIRLLEQQKKAKLELIRIAALERIAREKWKSEIRKRKLMKKP